MDTDLEQRLFSAAENYAESGQYTSGHLPTPPSKHLAIVACMEACIDLHSLFHLPLGGAHIIRNAGGHASDPSALRSLVISQQFLGTHTILILKHTDCSMTTFTPSDAQEKIFREMGGDAATRVYELVGRKWGCFEDVEAECRKDVKELLKEKSLKRGTKVAALVFDVKSGKVKKVEGAEGIVGEVRRHDDRRYPSVIT